MAGEPDVGQHLLVALKLLPDLRCYERTKMLCVNNRDNCEWLSEEHEMGSLLWPHPDRAHYTHVVRLGPLRTRPVLWTLLLSYVHQCRDVHIRPLAQPSMDVVEEPAWDAIPS